jgi:anti-anti-sigma factor
MHADTSPIHVDLLDTCQISVDCSVDLWTLKVTGELDLASGRQLSDLGDVLASSGTRTVALDLSGLDFVDTAGLQAVARTCGAVRAAGGAVTLIGTTSPALDRLLRALDGCGTAADPA